jgi:hypothetical protein
MSNLERRLERVAEAISGRDSECTSDRQGSVFEAQFVAPGDPVQEPDGEREQRCPQHPLRIQFERFDRTQGEYVKFDPKQEHECRPI